MLGNSVTHILADHLMKSNVCDSSFELVRAFDCLIQFN